MEDEGLTISELITHVDPSHEVTIASIRVRRSGKTEIFGMIFSEEIIAERPGIVVDAYVNTINSLTGLDVRQDAPVFVKKAAGNRYAPYTGQ